MLAKSFTLTIKINIAKLYKFKLNKSKKLMKIKSKTKII